jgi:hypothetical protein
VNGLLYGGLPGLYDFVQSRRKAIKLPLPRYHHPRQATRADCFLEVTKGAKFFVVLLVKHHGWLSIDGRNCGYSKAVRHTLI